MEALPRRMRERIIALYDQGVPTKQIAERLGACRSGTRRVRQQLRERGTLEPLTPIGGYASQLTDEMSARLRQLVAADAGSTRQTLKDRLGTSVDVRTVGRWLGKLGIVLKKSRSSPVEAKPDQPSRSDRTSKSVARTGTRR